MNNEELNNLIKKAEHIEEVYNNGEQESEDITEFDLVDLIVEMKDILKKEKKR